jgi:DNA-binding NarL/FixJ family response regulator
MIARGNKNTEIAERLNISAKTVEKHRASLMAKLGVHSVSKLMVYALREGMLDEHKQL